MPNENDGSGPIGDTDGTRRIAAALGAGAAPAGGAPPADGGAPVTADDAKALLQSLGLTLTRGADGKPVAVRRVKIDGEERVLTLDEVAQLAAQAGGAQSRMQKAADTMKAAKKLEQDAGQAMQVMNMIEAVKDGSQPIEARKAAAVQLGQLFGADPAEIVQAIQSDNGQGGDVGGRGKPAAAPAPITLDALPPELQELVAEARANRAQKYRGEIFGIADKAIDSDPVLGKLQGVRRQFFKELARNEVQRRVVAEQQPLSDELYLSVAQWLRTKAAAIFAGSDNSNHDGGGSGSGMSEADGLLAADEGADDLEQLLASGSPNLGGQFAASGAGLQATGSASGRLGQQTPTRTPATDGGWSGRAMSSIRRLTRALSSRQQGRANNLNADQR